MTAPGNTPASTAPVITSAAAVEAASSRARERHRHHTTAGSSATSRPPSTSSSTSHAEGQRQVLDVGCPRATCPAGSAESRRDTARLRTASRMTSIAVHAVEGAARLHGAEDDAGRPVERARLPELGEEAIEAIGPLVHVLEEDAPPRRDRAPRACRAWWRAPKSIPPSRRPRARPGGCRPAPRPPSRYAGSVSSALEVRERARRQPAGEVGGHHRAVDADDARARQRGQQRRGVAVADDRLRLSAERRRGRASGTMRWLPKPPRAQKTARMSGSSSMRCRSAPRAASGARQVRPARQHGVAERRPASPAPRARRLPAPSRASSTTPDGATTPTTSPLRIRTGFPIGEGLKLASTYRLTPRLSTKSCKNARRAVLVPQAMRPSAAQIARVAEALVRRLVEADVVALDAPEERVQARFVGAADQELRRRGGHRARGHGRGREARPAGRAGRAARGPRPAAGSSSS